MGTSRIEIVVTGNHGCDREAREGEPLGAFCGAANCVDCRIGEAVMKLRDAGANFAGGSPVKVDEPSALERCAQDPRYLSHGAKLTHWPGDPSAVVDDLVTRVRGPGQFKVR